jgi:hypothetical protein
MGIRSWFAAISVLAFFISANTSNAVTVYSNLDSGGSYNCCIAWTVSGISSGAGQFWDPAMQFVASVSADVTQFDLALSYSATSLGPNVGPTIKLFEDNGGVPGTQLGAWSAPNNLPTFGSTSNVLATISGITGIHLNAGSSYFLQAVPGNDTTWGGWNENATGATGIVWRSVVGGVQQTLGAFDVIGTDTGATPLPAALPLFLTGLGALGLLGWRRKRKQAA